LCIETKNSDIFASLMDLNPLCILRTCDALFENCIKEASREIQQGVLLDMVPDTCGDQTWQIGRSISTFLAAFRAMM
jgi:hypothetical protein